MSSANAFVHLHCHSHYSLLDGANRIPELVAQTKKLGMNSVALTDHGNLYGAIELYREATAAGIKPIIGYEAYIAPNGRTEKAAGRGNAASHLTLLAKNLAGYHNLIKLASIAFTEGYHYVPRIDRELLAAHSEGLVCLSGCLSGEFNEHLRKSDARKAAELAEWYVNVFGERFFIEIQNNGLQIQDDCTKEAVRIAHAKGIPLVATADAHYLCQTDADAHDVLICINTKAKRSDANRMRYGTDSRLKNPYYVRSPRDMYQLFPDFPDAVRRSQEIADSIDLTLDFKKRHFPVFQTPAGKTPDDYLREIARLGLLERYGPDPRPEVRARLEHELGIICRMGFSAYFLIVWDFVRFAIGEGIPCSARGSGCGAVVSYVLKLSHVCPMEYDLLFERFLDPNRSEAPDIDIDFCQLRREEVIAYVKRKYGEQSVAQIVTFGTLAAKAAIKDVGRVLDVPLDRVNALTKHISAKVGTTLESTMAESAEFRREYESDPVIRELVDIALRLEGTNRNAGTHAAGVVIANGPITDYVPVHRIMRKGEDGEKTKEAVIATQWVMGDLEKVGMLKMDFLGLRTLTLIENALRLIKKNRRVDIDLMKLPLDDADTYKMLQKGDAKGVFQFESEGIRRLLERMKPDNIRDIVASTALYRPGPLEGGMIDEYIDCKHGRKKPNYPHAVMEEVLSETYGVMVYQEQVMRILNRMGGIELSSAYACIKAISKKKYDIIDARKIDFVRGAHQKGMSEEKAEEVFELIVKFGGYGFNKCVVGSTRVMDAATGEIRTVGEMFRRPEPATVFALGGGGKLGPRRVEDVVWNGRKPVFRLTTELGNVLTATANHPLRTLDGWTLLGDLTPGDRIAAAKELCGAGIKPRAEAPSHLTPRPPLRSGEGGAAVLSVNRTRSRGLQARNSPSPLRRGGRGVRWLGAAPELVWDRVVSIEPAGEEDTYDLTVEGDHNFVAEGLVVHNSHSAAYAHVSYHTAWLKKHYPAEFFAALLSSEIDDGNKRDMLVDHIADAKRFGVQVLAPDVNRGEPEFSVVNTSIIFGLVAIKGLGRGAAEAILAERQKNGKYKDLYDFCERVDVKAVPRSAMEQLIKAGGMDEFARPFANRAQLMQALPMALQAAGSRQADRKRGQLSFFDVAGDDAEEAPEHATAALPQVEDWKPLEKLAFEKEALDFYFSSHPLAEYSGDLKRFAAHEIKTFADMRDGDEVMFGGMICGSRLMNTKTGKRFARFHIEDFSAKIECVMWPSDYDRYKELIADDRIHLFEGKIDFKGRGEEPLIILSRVLPMEQAVKELTKSMLLRLDYAEHTEKTVLEVMRELQKAKGSCQVYVQVRDKGGREVRLRLGREMLVDPAKVSVDHFETLLGPKSVQFSAKG